MTGPRVQIPRVGASSISQSRYLEPVARAVNNLEMPANSPETDPTTDSTVGDARGTVTAEGTNTLTVTLVDGRVLTVLKPEHLRGAIATRAGVDNPQEIFPSYTDYPEVFVRPIEPGSELFGASHYEVATARSWFEPV